MQKLITLRFALPAVVILTIIVIAIIVFTLATRTHHGTAFWPPCC